MRVCLLVVLAVLARTRASAASCVNTVFGSAQAASAAAVYTAPASLTLDENGQLYFSDAYSVFTQLADGSLNLLAGMGVSTTTNMWPGGAQNALQTAFYYPRGLAADVKRGLIYIADTWANRIFSHNLSSGLVTLFAGPVI